MSKATKSGKDLKNGNGRPTYRIEPPTEAVNTKRAELFNLDGERTLSTRIACHACGGYVYRGKVFGGWLPVAYVSEDGRVLETTATCVCEIGLYYSEKLERSQGRAFKYEDIDDDLRLPTAALDDEDVDIMNFHRGKFTELCRKVGQPYMDPKTLEWVEWVDGEEVRSRAAANKDTMEAIENGFARIKAKMQERGIRLPLFEFLNVKAAAGLPATSTPIDDRPAVAAGPPSAASLAPEAPEEGGS